MLAVLGGNDRSMTEHGYRKHFKLWVALHFKRTFSLSKLCTFLETKRSLQVIIAKP